MQDPQSTLGLSGCLFGGGGGGGGAEPRRLRGYGPAQPTAPPPPVKCPRCESANTKFCYYNNYSLSQPRHFCKSCRRYWTRGGVLRNVPVGGGCRKSSASSSKKPHSSHAAADKDRRRRPGAPSRSGSDSSFPAPDPPPIQAAPEPAEPDGFVSLLAGNTGSAAAFGFLDLPPIVGTVADQTVGIGGGGDGAGLNGLDWPVVDQSVYDLTSAVDQGLYWNPVHTHWADPDPSLYLP